MLRRFVFIYLFAEKWGRIISRRDERRCYLTNFYTIGLARPLAARTRKYTTEQAEFNGREK